MASGDDPIEAELKKLDAGMRAGRRAIYGVICPPH